MVDAALIRRVMSILGCLLAVALPAMPSLTAHADDDAGREDVDLRVELGWQGLHAGAIFRFVAGQL